MQYRGSLPIFPVEKTYKYMHCSNSDWQWIHENQVHYFTLTWVLGKSDVRSVSWVSSVGFLLGTLKIKAAWSGVAAVAVIR